jgi:hypothetical protein
MQLDEQLAEATNLDSYQAIYQHLAPFLAQTAQICLERACEIEDAKRSLDSDFFYYSKSSHVQAQLRQFLSATIQELERIQADY